MFSGIRGHLPTGPAETADGAEVPELLLRQHLLHRDAAQVGGARLHRLLHQRLVLARLPHRTR